ncbi:MAG: signal peptide peptidase SppA [Candidatus Symbiothrix sp.]|jgi:protease-4|nr:signal peptide peptidase SppA [Candidatus Symbiothrix sp.]
MKSFIKMIFASCLGVIIGGTLLLLFSMSFFIGMIGSMSETKTKTLKSENVLKINLNSEIADRATSDPFDLLLSGSAVEQNGLNNILSAIKKAKDSDKIKGIYLKGGLTQCGYATAEAIRKALLDFKTGGKFIIAYGENFTHRSYYICSVADSVFINPQGMMDFRGLASTIQYNKAILEKWGIEMQVFKVGTFKSAVEPYTESQMTPANREQTTAFLNDIWTTILQGISESRNISVEQLNSYADECLTFTDPKRLFDYYLIDGLRYEDDVKACLKNKLSLGKDESLTIVGVKDMIPVPESNRKISKDKIAVLYAEGEILDDALPSFYSQSAITAKEYIKELNRLKDDKKVKAVVFRVNSPGGSGYASEQIWHAVAELKKVKPVVVSMGTYAASGGYYISCGANKIIAESGTLTGSIGVFGMIPNGAQLAKRMGATYDGVQTNKHANFESEVLTIPLLGVGVLPARPLNQEESAMIQAYIDRFYDVFLTRVSDGRNISKTAVDSIAQGRVWTGNQALKLGLVDELGGIDRAIVSAAELADIQSYSVEEYPEEKDFFTSLLEESSESVGVKLMQFIMGTDRFNQQLLQKTWQGYDFRQAIVPQAFIDGMN